MEKGNSEKERERERERERTMFYMEIKKNNVLYGNEEKNSIIDFFNGTRLK